MTNQKYIFNAYRMMSFIILISFSFSKINQKRFLQLTEENDLDNNANKTSNETDTSNFTEEPGTYLLSWFVIFFFMGLYIVCSMKKYPSIAHRTDDVWKFMFFANNGILVAASVNIFDIKNLILDSSPFGLSSIVFIIGCIYYISKFCQACSMPIAAQYFECDKLGELYKIPCFVWSLVGMTDPCCRSTGYTVTVYTDGHTESNECCHHMWNCFIYLIKRLAIFFSIVSYYIFLLFYFIFWLIAKSIFICMLKIKTEKAQQPQPQQESETKKENKQEEIIYGSNSGREVIVGQKNNDINQNMYQGEPNKNTNNGTLNPNQIIQINKINNFSNDDDINGNRHNSRNNPDYLTLSPKQVQSSENLFFDKQNRNLNGNNLNLNNGQKGQIIYPNYPYEENNRYNNNYEINENNQRNDLPSENEINKPIKSVEIRKDEINNYRSENSNNMEEPPAPGLFDEQF